MFCRGSRNDTRGFSFTNTSSIWGWFAYNNQSARQSMTPTDRDEGETSINSLEINDHACSRGSRTVVIRISDVPKSVDRAQNFAHDAWSLVRTPQTLDPRLVVIGPQLLCGSGGGSLQSACWNSDAANRVDQQRRTSPAAPPPLHHLPSRQRWRRSQIECRCSIDTTRVFAFKRRMETTSFSSRADEGGRKELADELRSQVVDELLRRRKEIEWSIEGDFDAHVKRIELGDLMPM
ncbi:hypothetical protein Vadar_018184 [Vaccinium darrowii]|uniref:Uncharacterized protein n=1 Tax=Vaccinium darrowii TaxID=229202 RepID=A0ACB7X1Y6_9ERIC|nr:hypothetical protein Vadar_018184 [Vaccinium darrowii]